MSPFAPEVYAERVAVAQAEDTSGIDDIHRRMLDEAGYARQRYAACGYSLGATYRPSWMDVPPMIYSGNDLEIRPGMGLFPHVMLGDRDTGLAMGLGNTVLVTEQGAESLTRLPLDLMTKH
jgi:Xaa-Pro dipeptidase